MNVPSFAKIGRREIYDDILTIVIRFMGGTTALLRSRDGQPEDLISKFLHQDLGEEKSVTLPIGFHRIQVEVTEKKNAVVNPSKIHPPLMPAKY